MAIETTISIAAAREPDGFHLDGTGKAITHAFALYLSIEVTGNTGDEALASARIKDFLNSARTTKFKLYQRDSSGVLTEITNAPITVISDDAKPPIESDHVMAWLKVREAVFLSERADEVEILEGQQIPVSQLLSASVNWDAPVPQRMGLVLLVTVDYDFPGADRYFLLPKPVSNIGTPDVETDGLTVTVTLDSVVTTIRSQSLPVTWVPDSNVSDGFLKVETEVDNDRRLAQRIEERACSLLWAAPHFLGLESSSENQPALTLLNEKVIKRPSLATVMTASLLDPMLIALRMPGIDDADGPLLAPMITDLLTRLRVKSDNASLNDLAAKSNAKTLRSAWRNSIGLCPLLNPAASREVIVEQLKMQFGDSADKLFSLMRADDGSNAEFDAAVIRQLRELMTELQDEAGAERALVKLLQPYSGDKFVLEWTKAAMLGLDDEGQKLAESLCGEVFSAFERLLRGTFNAAEAIRRAVGQVYLTALSSNASGAEAPIVVGTESISARWQQMLLHVDNSMHFLVRAQLIVRPSLAVYPIDSMAAMFWRADAPIPAASKAWTALEDALKAVSREFARDLAADAVIQRKFLPDSTPQPLPIRIAPNMSAGEVEKFNDRYGGVGVVIRREGEGWRHACLTKLLLNNYPEKKPAEGIEEHAVRTLTPVVSDGRGEMFISYAGFPLSSSAFEPDEPDADDQKSQANLYHSEEASYVNADDPKPVPSLCYGKTYQVASFVVSKSGALPAKLQRAAGQECWYPKLDLSGINPPMNTFKFQRRTAIGRINVQEEGTKRLGARYPDIEPLSLDDPRSALAAPAASSIFIDLARNADGSGTIDLQAISAMPFELSLAGMRHGGTGTLTLTMHTELDGSNGSTSVLIGGLEMKVEVKAGTPSASIVGARAIFETDLKQGRAWLRLTASDGQQVSFARLETDASKTQYSSDAQPPVLLMAPTDAVWRDVYKTFSCTVKLSRVGFLDFDYWPGSPDYLRAALLGAYVIAAGDPNDLAVLEIANLLDQLPDPAVAGYLVTATVLDSVGQKVPESKSAWLDKAIVPAVGQLTSLFDYQKWLSSFANSSTATLSVEAKDKLDVVIVEKQRLINVIVMPGDVVKLSVQPLVEKRHFDTLIDKRLRQHSLGLHQRGTVDYLIFPGEQFLVEAMSAGLTALPDALFNLKSEGLERAYALIADPSIIPTTDTPAKKAWRLVSQCDVATQRWRFSGKPIYQWIDPKACASKDQQDHAAMRLSEKTNDIDAIERQLFFDRSDSDQNGIRVRIPSPEGEHLLQKVEWAQPSATYFRHRFTLWSRYRGAMASGARSVNSWPTKPTSDLTAWTVRAAILADATRLQLTRPQLRALIPLSDGLEDQPEASPPLAAILEEPPFAFGGLADRVLAGIQIGAGYGFEAQNTSVTPLDLRHELGMDPRLSQFAMKEKDALASTLSLEGPVGLHFERADASAPAWANTQYLLTPTLLNGDGFVRQEAFFAVRMMRLLDPHWVAGNSLQAALSLETTRSYLAEFSGNGTLSIGANQIVQVKKSLNTWTIEIDRQYIDSTATSTGLKIAELTASQIVKIQLIHWPINSRSYGLAVLALPKQMDFAQAIEQGVSSVPRVLALLEWQPREAGNVLRFENATQLHNVSLSQVTDQQWARTARNSKTTYIKTGPGIQQPIAIADVRLMTNETEFWFRRTPDQASMVLQAFKPEGNYPQTVHRHLAAVLTAWSEGLGRRFDTFRGAVLIRADKSKFNGAMSISAARLLEFQVPAKAIAIVGTDNSAPEQFRDVYLDLQALGTFDAYWLHLQVYGEQGEVSLALTVYGQKGTSSIVTDAFNPALTLNIVDYYLRKKDGNWPLGADNKPVQGPLIGLNVRLTSKAATTVWADVSILPLQADNAFHSTMVEWDWFFTNKGGNAGELAEPLAVEKLKQLSEASAQIVSFGPRIALAKK